MVIIIAMLIGLGYFFYGLQPSVDLVAGIDFQVKKGESFRSIAARLSQESIIRSIAVFKFYALVTGKAQRFQPGVFTLNSNMSIPEIVNVLSSSAGIEVEVVIPEGSTVKDIDQILSEAGVIEAGAIANHSLEGIVTNYPFLELVPSLEGFLFPDTYRFELESESDEVVERLLDNFNSKAWKDIENERNWYHVLILASILEREVPKFEDRQIVAGLLLKRLDAGIPLQVDATLSYSKCGGNYLNCNNIQVTRSDTTKLISAYNTYERLGWTPTPISNPGEEAIAAALSPQPSPYWYYLSARTTGETIFSKTLDEHNENRVKYL